MTAKLIVAFLFSVCSACAAAGDIAPASRQLVLVITADWNADQGVLQTYERSDGQWRTREGSTRVSIGRAGSGWGVGVHAPQPGVQKREGDGRSPAGAFALGPAFGYAAHEHTGIPYRAMTEADYCIDAVDSPHYNRIVDARVVGHEAVARATEPMRRDIHLQGDSLYKLGFVIAHNPRNSPTRGSCIFAHLWRGPEHPTAGCTAMSETAMRELLRWLDAEQQPIFVLLPEAEYRRLREPWGLPADVPEP